MNARVSAKFREIHAPIERKSVVIQIEREHEREREREAERGVRANRVV